MRGGRKEIGQEEGNKGGGEEEDLVKLQSPGHGNLEIQPFPETSQTLSFVSGCV